MTSRKFSWIIKACSVNFTVGLLNLRIVDIVPKGYSNSLIAAAVSCRCKLDAPTNAAAKIAHKSQSQACILDARHEADDKLAGGVYPSPQPAVSNAARWVSFRGLGFFCICKRPCLCRLNGSRRDISNVFVVDFMAKITGIYQQLTNRVNGYTHCT